MCEYYIYIYIYIYNVDFAQANQGRYEAALKAFEEALALQPGHANAARRGDASAHARHDWRESNVPFGEQIVRIMLAWCA